jgi:flagellar basal body P-ring formation protein FlgA
MSRTIFRLLLVTIAVCLYGQFSDSLSAADTKKAYIFIKPEAEVSDWQVLLSDVAEVQGLDEVLITQLSGINLGPAPPPGEVNTYERAEIRRRIVLNRIDPINVALLGAEHSQVTHSGRVVGANELKALVEDYIVRSWAGQNARTEITYSRLPEKTSLSSSDLELKVIDPLKERVSGSTSLSLAAFSGDRLLQRFPVSLKVRSFEKVVVLKNSLGNDQELAPEDVEIVEHETTGSRTTPLRSIEEVVGKRLKRRIKAGQILTQDCVEHTPLIERGDEVTLLVQYKNITVSCPGKAWQKGCLGEKILVRNQYGKNLTGTVQDAQTVVISQ